MNKEIEYANKIVFFLDLLGFKDLIDGKRKRTPNDIKEMFDNIKWHLDEREPCNYFSQLSTRVTTRQKTQFSDSIIITFDYNEPSALFFALLDIQLLQINFLWMHRVLLRGACSVGMAYHGQDYVFGPAVNEAYKLEKDFSKYPRIIVSENIIDICAKYSSAKNTPEEEKSYLKEMLMKDKDYYFIDYISHAATAHLCDDLSDWPLFMIELRKMIEIGLKSKDRKIKRKHSWLKSKYNKALKLGIVKSYRDNFRIILEKI